MIGVTIGGKHTFHDWGLKWCRLSIGAPEVQRNFIQVPGKQNGEIDLSDALNGFPTYNNRQLSFEFDTTSWLYDEWQEKYSDVLNSCHGQRERVILDTDPGFYYAGRLSVSSEKETLATDTLTIELYADPFKYELNSSIEDWLWDPFNFESGIIREYKELQVDGSLTLEIMGRSLRVAPVIACSAPMTVTYQGKTYSLSAGSNKILDLCLGPGNNVLLFQGNGTVSVEYRGGLL